MHSDFQRRRQGGEYDEARETVFAAAAYDDIVAGSIIDDKSKSCWASFFPCTCDAWKERGKFVGKNFIALLAGFVISVGTRLIISAAKGRDPECFSTTNGANLTVTDVAGSFISLVICSAWVRPMASAMSWGDFLSSPKALGRSTLRNAMPFLTGCLSMFLTKFIDYKVNGPDHVYNDKNNNRVAELSDFVGTFLLLITFHIVDCILERRWPADMTQDPNFGERLPMLNPVKSKGQRWPAYQATLAPAEAPEMPRRRSGGSDNGYVSGGASSGDGYYMGMT